MNFRLKSVTPIVQNLAVMLVMVMPRNHALLKLSQVGGMRWQAKYQHTHIYSIPLSTGGPGCTSVMRRTAGSLLPLSPSYTVECTSDA